MNHWLWGCLILAVVAGCNRADTQSRSEREVSDKTAEAQGGPETAPIAAQIPAARAVHFSGSRKAEVDSLFTNATLLRIDIDIPRGGMSTLRSTHWGNGVDRPVVKATIREGGATYPNVGVHLKGAAGSFRSVDDKPALTLAFDKFVPEQSFHGLHKISLNNSVQDSTFLSEKISRELFIAAGVPVPRAAHALVRLNGRDLGLYVLLEGANKQFLKHYFTNVTGNLYDGGFCRDITPSLPVNCGDNPKNNTGLKSLCATVRQHPDDLARLEKVLDVDRFLSMVALEMMLCHWDGYSMNVNNWRIFHDLGSNRMVFIPHGLDQMFGAGGQFNPGNPIVPLNAHGEVTKAVLNTKQGPARYRERFGELYTNVFRADQIALRLDEIAKGLQQSLAQSDPQLASSMQQHADALKGRIRRRAGILARQLGPPPTPLQFTKENAFPLSGWTPYVTSGRPNHAKAQEPEGKSVLAINAGDALSSSSWRTRVTLRAGRYRFEGRLRVNGVVIDPGDNLGGAALRISKGATPRKLTGSGDWTEQKYPFTVKQDEDVELVCELRATKGEAWFDPSSLKLVRLP
jgi:spore coat protein H